jgi:hypothetical protein
MSSNDDNDKKPSSPAPGPHMDLMLRFAALESGHLPPNEALALWEELINSGRVWSLAGQYQDIARRLIGEGQIKFRN